MSDLALTVALGWTGNWSDVLKRAAVFGALYVGGSGAWTFHQLDLGSPTRSVRVFSDRHLDEEVAAGYALAVGDPEVDRIAKEVLGQDWLAESVDVSAKQARRLAAALGDRVGAALITSLQASTGTPDSLARELATGLTAAGWSVTVAAPRLRVEDRDGVLQGS